MSDNRLIALFVVASLIFGAVWLYYGVLDNEDPLEVTKTVEYSNLSIEVPESWEVQTIEEPDERLIVSSEDVVSYDPWQTLRDFENPEKLYLNMAYSLAFGVDGTTSYIVLQRVPQEIQYLIEGVATSVEEYYASEDAPAEQEAQIERKTLQIGDSILFNVLEVNLEAENIWEGNDTLFVGTYLAQITQNQQYHLFMMVVVDENDEQRGQSWEARAREFLDSVEISENIETEETG